MLTESCALRCFAALTIAKPRGASRYGKYTVEEINMAQYVMPAARNTKTGQKVKQQQLNGYRFTLAERDQAWAISQSLAESLSTRTRESWIAEPITYTDN